MRVSRDGDQIDFAAFMERAARKICGEPNARLSDKVELRFGTNGSLKVIIAGADRGTFYDHEAKLGGGVLDFLRHKLNLANGAAVEWLQIELGAPRREAPKKGTARKIVATYDYVDEAGELLYQAVRYEPKEFKQRQPGPDGGWVWNLRGVRLEPYRLPSLLANIEGGRTIYIVEGEKDADNLIAVGLPATCNAMGAGKWQAEFARYFEGADVVVIPDNDASGRSHAQQVARNLASVARSVRFLDLPGLPPKGDVSDWLAAGGTGAELQHLADGAPLFAFDAEEEAPDSALGEWDAGDDDAPIEPRGWLLGNTFCRRYISSLVAAGGVGKTALRIAQALAVCTGRPITGEHVFQRCRVLLLSLEDDRDELRRRVRAALIHHGISRDDIKGWLFLATPAAFGWKLAAAKDGKVETGELAAKIVDTIRRRRIDLVILDPFVKSHAVEENANNQVDIVVGILARIAIENDCAVDAPHHLSKGAADPGNADRGRGASAFKDGARLVYTLAPMSEEEAEGFGLAEDERRRLIRMDPGKVNLAPAASQATWFGLVSVSIGNGTDLYPNGDDVQTIEPWKVPDLWDGLSHLLLNDILSAIDRGLPDGSRYSDHGAAKDRAAWKVVLQHAPDRTEKQARQIIRTWVKTGLLTMKDYDDPVIRKPAKGLTVNHAKRPS